jgi:predicted Zn-dependent peptidase
MAILNRQKSPKIQNISKIKMNKAVLKTLSNGLPVYLINSGTQDVMKIEFLFDAGHWYEKQSLVATAANGMMSEGSKKYSGHEIAEKFDFLGTFFQLNVDNDTASVSILTLNRHLSESLEIVEDVIKNPAYPKNEFETYIAKKKQQFNVESTKVKTQARRKFNELLFGENHPYGSTTKMEDFDKLNIKKLQDFHKLYYHSGNCKIIISGKIAGNTIKLLDKFFGKDDWKTNTKTSAPKFKINSTKQNQHILLKDDAVQSAVRIGKVTFNKLHADYMGLQVLNTILGGYFGSRLMSNIREDKGYTYGIGSVLASFKHSGLFVIVSEVGADVCSAAIKEIYFELDKLCKEKVSEEELLLVKNYMLGEMIRLFDGPFALADAFKSLLEHNLDYDYYDRFIETIKNITPDDLQKLAKKYFKPDTMIEVVAGKK